MSNVVHMPQQSKVHDEAGDWLSKLDRGISGVEEQSFQAWICADQAHYDTFMSMSKIWDGMDDLSRLSDIFPDELKQSTPHWGQRFAIASCAIFALVLINVFVGYDSKMFNTNAANYYETIVGEQSTIYLDDGTKLVLNTNSAAKVSYSVNHRLISLERGEIHVDVAHDKTRPLSVKAGDKIVQAVGTAFNIELFEDRRFELIVTDGSVRISDRASFERLLNTDTPDSQVHGRIPEGALSVSKGESLVVGHVEQAHITPIKIEAVEIEENLSWRSGNLIFDGQRLGEAIKEISRYTSVEFKFSDNEIKNVKIAGLFKTGDVNGLLIALDSAFDISSTRTAREEVMLHWKEP